MLDDLTELLGAASRTDDDAAAVVKHDPRMATVLARALYGRLGEPTERLVVPDGAYRWRISEGAQARLMDEIWQESPRYGAGRERLRSGLVDLVRRQAERRGLVPGEAWARQVGRSQPVRDLLDRLWPRVDPADVVAEFLSDPAVAADGILSDAEQAAIRRSPPQVAGWSPADLVLIDEVAGLIEQPAHGSLAVLGALALTAGLRVPAAAAGDRGLTTVDDVPAQHAPADPRLAPLTEGTADLEHEGLSRRLSFTGLDLSAQEADAVEFDQCRFERTTLASAVLDQPRFTDCEVSHCDWANARLTKPALLRTRLTSVRLTGAQCTAGTLRDVTFEDCRADLAGFRFTTFAHVRLTGCNLTGADFTGADLRRAEFIGCDLTGAQFSNANAAGARFTDCDLDGIGGVTSLSGATITADDLIALSHTFARALGITVVASPQR
ncbi:Uncharacterized protein YjbI, contains pentapeptide repeats [Asanoa hainanensis]|uniref:Uncharacterized protein YjbI, contains pentapeptide repeats n=1 Tax=Asanoa hainanensis TaxID=560556 RepID=A0A239LJ22_9ACTN|nr:pentapeptide repeat-containing protein [Asanoa hainanensis]SNT29898.1 Uncharacterized protein YjbI, contains pentapeptide repeats [Asanoa hainanensis]